MYSFTANKSVYYLALVHGWLVYIYCILSTSVVHNILCVVLWGNRDRVSFIVLPAIITTITIISIITITTYICMYECMHFRFGSILILLTVTAS